MGQRVITVVVDIEDCEDFLFRCCVLRRWFDLNMVEVFCEGGDGMTVGVETEGVETGAVGVAGVVVWRIGASF